MIEARMFLQLLADFDSLFGEVHLVRQANQHGTFVREEGTGGFLALVVSEGVVVGEAEDFDYDDRSAYSLTLAFDDSLRRVAYGSQECYKPWRPEAPCGKILLWAFPHIYVRSGYILGATTFASLVTRLLKRSLAPENIKKELPASLRPKESLSLTQMPGKNVLLTLPFALFIFRVLRDRIMARPIKETPTLRGEDARIFEKKIANPKPVSREDVLAAQNAYNRVMSIAKFSF